MPRTVQDVVDRIGLRPEFQLMEELPAPRYVPPFTEYGYRFALGVSSMADHMSNEGWQLMQGLQEAGYNLWCGSKTSPLECNNVIHEIHRPRCVVVQDKREWDPSANRLAHQHEYIKNIQVLAKYDDVFKVTVLKDSHQRPYYHRDSAEEMGCHAWITYYHPRIVKHLAPYVREQHLIRTTHTIDADRVPEPSDERNGCLLSGAVGNAVYPLRTALAQRHQSFPRMDYIRHPGYHNSGTNTNQYLQTLNQYKVAICTSSIFGYSLRKIIEATACGCVVITDLPVDDPMPHIDGNLIRLQANDVAGQCEEIMQLLPTLYRTYNADQQAMFARLAKQYYDYRAAGKRLAADIEQTIASYGIDQ